MMHYQQYTEESFIEDFPALKGQDELNLGKDKVRDELSYNMSIKGGLEFGTTGAKSRE